MNEYNNFSPQRADLRKKRKLNRLMNISIGLVVLLIIVVGIALFTGGDDEDQAAPHNNDTETTNNDEDVNQDGGNISVDTEENNTENNVENSIDENIEDNTIDNEMIEEENNSAIDENENENNTNENNEEETINEVPDGEWEPIGTSQSEPFELQQSDFAEGSTNRNEMERALEYATGIPVDEMNLFRIENGGDLQSAVGTVGRKGEDRNTPYRVRIEWVENEGWMPVSVEQLSSNPY